ALHRLGCMARLAQERPLRCGAAVVHRGGGGWRARTSLAVSPGRYHGVPPRGRNSQRGVAGRAPRTRRFGSASQGTVRRVALVLLFAGCTSLTVRPSYRPFPLASVDTVTGNPTAVLEAARDAVAALGMQLRNASPEEGYLETSWFDLTSRKSHRENTRPERY